MTPTTKAGPKSVKFMAIAQLDNNAYFSMHGMFKKKSTVFSLQHTHALMSMHCQVSSKHMSVGGEQKERNILVERMLILYPTKNAKIHLTTFRKP